MIVNLNRLFYKIKCDLFLFCRCPIAFFFFMNDLNSGAYEMNDEWDLQEGIQKDAYASELNTLSKEINSLPYLIFPYPLVGPLPKPHQ